MTGDIEHLQLQANVISFHVAVSGPRPTKDRPERNSLEDDPSWPFHPNERSAV